MVSALWGGLSSVTMPNCIKIGGTVAEISWQFNHFHMAAVPFSSYPHESFREDYGITGVRLSVCLSVC